MARTDDEELQVIEERDIYTHSAADIPSDAKLLESVKNRPVAYVGLGILALVVMMIAVPKYWIAFSLIIVLFIVIFLLNKNDPVLDIYEGFIVVYKKGDPGKICIIPDEHLIYWQLVSSNTSFIQIVFADETDPENALSAMVHTINMYQASNALDRYYREKAIVEIRREQSRRKSLLNRKQQ